MPMDNAEKQKVSGLLLSEYKRMAALDLYEALEALTEQYIDSFHDIGRCAPAIEHDEVIAARKALAAARGES